MKKKHPLEVLIEQGEHQQQDFKFEVSDSKKIARTLSAFANTDGGRLLIGVKDNGRISGIKGDEEYYMIEAASKMYTRPEVPFSSNYWNIEGKTVLEIDIEPCPDRPYLAPDKDDKYKAYVRIADENIIADEIMVRAWRKQNSHEGILLRLSEPVKILLAYMEKCPNVSVGKFCRIAHISYNVARNILSDMMAMDMIGYVMVDKRIMFSLNKNVNSLIEGCTHQSLMESQKECNNINFTNKRQ